MGYNNLQTSKHNDERMGMMKPTKALMQMMTVTTTMMIMMVREGNVSDAPSNTLTE